MAHHKDVCEYGYTHSQCRCASPTKLHRTVVCDIATHAEAPKLNHVHPKDLDVFRHMTRVHAMDEATAKKLTIMELEYRHNDEHGVPELNDPGTQHAMLRARLNNFNIGSTSVGSKYVILEDHRNSPGIKITFEFSDDGFFRGWSVCDER